MEIVLIQIHVLAKEVGQGMIVRYLVSDFINQCGFSSILYSESYVKNLDILFPISQVCAQECNNFGICVAPDTCKCKQWPNQWRDNRIGGGVPLYQKPNGDPQMTGWT